MGDTYDELSSIATNYDTNDNHIHSCCRNSCVAFVAKGKPLISSASDDCQSLPVSERKRVPLKERLPINASEKSVTPVSNTSPIKKTFVLTLAETNILKKKARSGPQFGVNKSVVNESSSLSNVSDVRKRFEMNCPNSPNSPNSEEPETLTVAAKMNLFEKAILTEHSTKEKYYVRKRVATGSADEMPVKRAKTSEPFVSSESRPVANNIATRAQLLQLFSGINSSTAILSDIEYLKKEVELLKRPIKCSHIEVEDISRDDSNINSGECEETVMPIDVQFESPTKRNRLYPDLVTLEDCHNIHESPPPVKPPRLYGETVESGLVPTFVYGPTVSAKADEDLLFNALIAETQQRIAALTDAMKMQEKIGAQARQALKLCLESDEFNGSTEQVEAERLLLLTGKRIMAGLNEIARLKNTILHKSFKLEKSKGRLSVSSLQLPLNYPFLVERANGSDPNTHYYICLLYNKSEVFSSGLLNSEEHIRNGQLVFECGVSYSDLTADFQIGVQIFELAIRKRCLPHDIKYHIKKKPKKYLKRNRQSPTVRSPGAPNPLLGTSFSLVGKFNININNYENKRFTIDSLYRSSTLAGGVVAQIGVTVVHNYKHEGFLNMGTDRSICMMGYFFALNGHELSYWWLNEADKNKKPRGVIDLKYCRNPSVAKVSPEVCSRKHTFGLLIAAPNNPEEKYLMSAINREEFDIWTKKLGEALEGIRRWHTASAQPFSQDLFEKSFMALN